jgi:hypothetical protein
LKPKREREEKVGGSVRHCVYKGKGKSYVYGYEGPQPVPAGPGKGGLERR